MQHGDLAVSVQPRWIVVLEGVLALVTGESSRKRLRRTHAWHIQWHEIPLKRMCVMKERWPDNHLEIVSFTAEDLIEKAAEYLDTIRVPYDSLSYYEFDQFCDMLRFNPDVQAVYDSNLERLECYGQVGHGVGRARDF